MAMTGLLLAKVSFSICPCFLSSARYGVGGFRIEQLHFHQIEIKPLGAANRRLKVAAETSRDLNGRLWSKRCDQNDLSAQGFDAEEIREADEQVAVVALATGCSGGGGPRHTLTGHVAVASAVLNQEDRAKAEGSRGDSCTTGIGSGYDDIAQGTTVVVKNAKGTTLYRVRVGPYASKDAAAAAHDKLKGEGQDGNVVPVH